MKRALPFTTDARRQLPEVGVGRHTASDTWEWDFCIYMGTIKLWYLGDSSLWNLVMIPRVGQAMTGETGGRYWAGDFKYSL